MSTFFHTVLILASIYLHSAIIVFFLLRMLMHLGSDAATTDQEIDDFWFIMWFPILNTACCLLFSYTLIYLLALRVKESIYQKINFQQFKRRLFGLK